MPEESFFLNYGSCGIPKKGTISQDQSISLVEKTNESYAHIVKLLTNANERYYCQLKVFGTLFQALSFTTQEFQVGEINVNVHQYGLTHRAIEVTLLENAGDQDRTRYEKALAIAREVICHDYALLENNCVTAVAAVLHTLDPKITKGDLVSPAKLDRKVNAYARNYWLTKKPDASRKST